MMTPLMLSMRTASGRPVGDSRMRFGSLTGELGGDQGPAVIVTLAEQDRQFLRRQLRSLEDLRLLIGGEAAKIRRDARCATASVEAQQQGLADFLAIGIGRRIGRHDMNRIRHR